MRVVSIKGGKMRGKVLRASEMGSETVTTRRDKILAAYLDIGVVKAEH